MVMPKFLKVLNKGLIAGVIVGAFGFFIKSVPCKITTIDSSSLGFCRFPSITQNLPSNLPNVYYGVSNNPATGLILQVILITLFVAIFLTLFKRKAAKILDLTNKK